LAPRESVEAAPTAPFASIAHRNQCTDHGALASDPDYGTSMPPRLYIVSIRSCSCWRSSSAWAPLTHFFVLKWLPVLPSTLQNW